MVVLHLLCWVGTGWPRRGWEEHGAADVGCCSGTIHCSGAGGTPLARPPGAAWRLARGQLVSGENNTCSPHASVSVGFLVYFSFVRSASCPSYPTRSQLTHSHSHSNSHSHSHSLTHPPTHAHQTYTHQLTHIKLPHTNSHQTYAHQRTQHHARTFCGITPSYSYLSRLIRYHFTDIHLFVPLAKAKANRTCGVFRLFDLTPQSLPTPVFWWIHDTCVYSS